jgi:hypothetical protein
VTDRGEQLASTIDQQSREFAQFLTGWTESDLRLPCADPSGSTVDAVLSHLGEGYDLVLGWLERVAKGAPADGPGSPGGDPAADGHAHDHQPGSLRTHAERLRRGEQTWAALVRGLSDAQLDLVPPAAQDITDGTRPLAEIMDRMIEHQSIHLDYVRDAVPGLAPISERAT